MWFRVWGLISKTRLQNDLEIIKNRVIFCFFCEKNKGNIHRKRCFPLSGLSLSMVYIFFLFHLLSAVAWQDQQVGLPKLKYAYSWIVIFLFMPTISLDRKFDWWKNYDLMEDCYKIDSDFQSFLGNEFQASIQQMKASFSLRLQQLFSMQAYPRLLTSIVIALENLQPFRVIVYRIHSVLFFYFRQMIMIYVQYQLLFYYYFLSYKILKTIKTR